MAQFALKTALPNYLRDEQQRIEEFGRSVGLDFFPTIFEVLSYDQMNEIAAYGGFPTRYPHWRWGMEYERLSKSHEYGLSKIYELVINNNPSIAYLLEGNSLVDQKLVMAHVYGHVDFFKHNFCFRMTNQGRDPKSGGDVRKWIDTLANHGAIVRKWANRIGLETVESFIDACLSLENLIDPQKPSEVEIVLGDGGTIEGRVTVGGKPSAGVYVNVSHMSGGFHKNTRTDAEGRFSFGGLLLFLALALWWFVALAIENPDRFRYFLVDEVWNRLFTVELRR